jgi:hypothetical protein
VTGTLTGALTDEFPDTVLREAARTATLSSGTIRRVYYPYGYNPATDTGSPVGNLGVLDPVDLWSRIAATTAQPRAAPDEFIAAISVCPAELAAVARISIIDPGGCLRIPSFELPGPADPQGRRQATRFAVALSAGDRIVLEWALAPAATPGALVTVVLDQASVEATTAAGIAAEAVTIAPVAGLPPRKQTLATQVITGVDAALVATLAFVPVAQSLALFLNGVEQHEGTDYSRAATVIIWLAGTGTAVDMDATDQLDAYYHG